MVRKVAMNRWTAIAGLLLTASLAPAAARAQEAAPEPFRKFDVGGSVQIGFFSINEDHVARTPAFNVDFGQYWTPHLKTTFALTSSAEYEDFVNYRPLPGGASQYTDEVARNTGVSAGVAWQFLDNAFVHPYVAGGAQLGWVSVVQRTYPGSFAPGTSVNLSSRVESRPWVGGGFKSYFDNGRAFMRTELSLIVNPNGSPATAHPVLRIGAGFDF